MCSGGMRRYMEEHQWRRRLSGLQLTLRRELIGAVGSIIHMCATPAIRL